MAAYQAIPINFDEYFSSSPTESFLPRSNNNNNDGDRDHRKKLMLVGGLLGALIVLLLIGIPLLHHNKHHQHQALISPSVDLIDPPYQRNSTTWSLNDDQNELEHIVFDDEANQFEDEIPDELELASFEDDLQYNRDWEEKVYEQDKVYELEDPGFEQEYDQVDEPPFTDDLALEERSFITPKQDKDDFLSEDFYNEDDKMVDDMVDSTHEVLDPDTDDESFDERWSRDTEYEGDEFISEEFYNEDDEIVQDMGVADDAFHEELMEKVLIDEFP